MNERIRELAEQAIANVRFWNAKNEAYNVGHDELAKFAELIVRECVEQVWYSREDGINGNVSQVIKDRIKEHFGVEP